MSKRYPNKGKVPILPDPIWGNQRRPGSKPTGSQSSVTSPQQPLGPNGQPFIGPLDPTNGGGSLGPETASRWSGWIAGLNNLGQGGNLLSAIEAFRNSGYGLTPDQENALLQFFLQYSNTIDQRQYDQQLTADQRLYDWNLTQDQRLYDNAQNQLARLMGAGISRDAAIQLLGSMSGGSSVVGNGTPVAQSSQSVPGITNTNRDLALANTVLQGVQSVVSMVANGIDMFTAVKTAQAQSAQTYMTQQQLKSYQSVNDLVNYLQGGVTNGVYTQDDLNSWSNADDMYKWLNDHRDTNFVKPIYDNGLVQSVFGNTIAREMLNRDWQQRRESRDAGTIYDNFVRQQKFKTELDGWNAKKAYQDLQYAIGELSRQDVEIQRLWNDVFEGNIRIRIAGKDLEIKGYQANQEKTRNDIFNAVYNTPEVNDNFNGEALVNRSGAFRVAYSQWSNLDDAFYSAFAKRGTAERRDAWQKYFMNNTDAACACAAIKKMMSDMQFEYVNKDQSPVASQLISFYELLKLSGALDVIEVGVDVGSRFL